MASVVERFERRVDSDPKHDAVRRVSPRAGGSVSFAQLDASANAIASDLIHRRGSKPEPVPIMVCAPELMLAAALGTLKAGKFYAAVNPLHPAPRVQRMLDELDAPLLLCDRRGEVAARRGPRALSVEELVARSSDGRPGLRFDGGRLAYVLYTSGSTGRPRGVAQSRRDMLHNVTRHRALAVEREDCVSLISADGFVAAVSNVYVALLGGGALAPYSFRDAGVEGMLAWLKATGVTVLYAFPSFLRQLAATEMANIHGGLRLAYLGGETVLRADLAAARRLFPAAALSVGLNSSETGLTCLHLIPPGSELPDPVPAGRPVTDVEVAIVDERGTPLTPGEAGEIEIRSEYVRPRYWGRGGAIHDDEPPAVSLGMEGGRATIHYRGAPVHVPTTGDYGDIHDNGTPAPAFRTGDRGRIDADGIVHHLGRVDGMVKIRGFRVETAEVESVISALPDIAEVAVLAVGEDRAALELAACVVGRGAGVDPVAIRGAVARELPSAMIPARVLILDELPRTPNGKLDRRSLRGLLGTPPGLGTATAPAAANGSVESPRACEGDVRRESVERRIAGIWSSELGIEEVSPDESFFALGGTSIMAISLVARVRRELGVRVPLAVLFKTPTVTALAATVIEMQGERATGGSVDRRIAVRLAREADFPEICTLVNHYIESTTFNFRTEPQTPGEWIGEWAATRTSYPWLVAIVDDVLAGLAYAGPWKGRRAYDWCAEVTVYVARDAQRRGIGRALYRQLLDLLDGQGYRTEIAAIALPNEPSVALHEACGFRHMGTLSGVGYKHGEWLDVGFWQRRQGSGETPAPIRTVPGDVPSADPLRPTG